MTQQYVLVPADLLKEAGNAIPCTCQRQCSGDCLRIRLLKAVNPVNVPEYKVGGGFIEIGQYDGRNYQVEADVDFFLSSDREIAWAKIGPASDLPLVEPAELERLAWAILDDVNDDELAVMAMAQERAACGGWPKPESIQEYLLYIEDEAVHQEAAAQNKADASYAAFLRALAAELRELGFTPAPAPWATEAQDA